MTKAKKPDDEVYFPPTIPDIISHEIERISREAKERDNTERTVNLEKSHNEKSDLIKTINEDRKTYTINTIIDFAEARKRTIPYSYFPYQISEQQLFTIFMNKLQTAGCFSSYSSSPFKDAYHSEYIFDGINIPLLQQFRDTGNIVEFQPGQTVVYDAQKKSLYFKSGDGSLPEIIDFSTAPSEFKLFDCFWKLKTANPKKTLFTRSQIQQIYIDLYNEEIITRSVSYTASNIRKRVRNKKQLLNRFILEFDKNEQLWHFSVS